MYKACVVAALALAGTGAMAQEPPRQVEVKGIKNPQLRSYRAAVAGLDAFDKHRALAPQADPVQFVLKPNANSKTPELDGITLHIVGKGDAIAVPIENGRFTIARNQAAYDDKADLLFNHKRDLFSSHAEVRTPGVPGNVRRLGDLRLECKVNVAIIKAEIPFYMVAAINALFTTTDWCKKIGIQFSVPSKGLKKVMLVNGDRRQELAPRDLTSEPTADLAWPDDTLVEPEYERVL